MTNQYWVIISSGVIVGVKQKPKDRLEALADYIMGTSFCTNTSSTKFVNEGGECELSRDFRIVETDIEGVRSMVDDGINSTQKTLDRLNKIKEWAGMQE